MYHNLKEFYPKIVKVENYPVKIKINYPELKADYLN